MGIAAPRRTCTFGFDWESDCQITHYSPKSWTSVEVAGRCFGVPWGCTLRSVGRHIALDAGAAILAASLCGVEPEVASHALESLALPPMRMEIREINGATILLDTYNASPPSMLAAIETLCEMPASGKRYAILGQMLELGGAEKEAHSRVGEAVSSSCLDEVIFVGDSMKYALARVGNVTASLVESDKEPRDLVARMAPGDSMLIKGSRALQLERILGSA
jgi:UDP-N-acetylmuramoyl-tripeptide--D-alanyl-D-alanine ligase